MIREEKESDGVRCGRMPEFVGDKTGISGVPWVPVWGRVVQAVVGQSSSDEAIVGRGGFSWRRRRPAGDRLGGTGRRVAGSLWTVVDDLVKILDSWQRQGSKQHGEGECVYVWYKERKSKASRNNFRGCCKARRERTGARRLKSSRGSHRSKARSRLFACT